MSEEPFLLATTVRIAISQRLLRRLCPECRERYIPSQEQIDELEKTFGIGSAADRRKVHELEQRAANEGIDSNRHVNTTPSRITSLWRASEEGCEACNHSGYQGSIAIVEVLTVRESLQKGLLDRLAPRKLHDLALKDGFVPLGLDGLVKALRGQTTVQEVLRTVVL
jgi:type II secretory ATPase GspE/PulE/Tfp pilus assembly ATPase PilB-like protein